MTHSIEGISAAFQRLRNNRPAEYTHGYTCGYLHGVSEGEKAITALLASGDVVLRKDVELLHEYAANELNDWWGAFCDADIMPDREGFTERMEHMGFIDLVRVTKDALQDPFAAERGIEKGGTMWVLTDAGEKALARFTKPAEGK